MWRCFANIYLYLPLIFSNGFTRLVVEYDKLLFQPEFICNAVWRMFPNIYLFLPLNLSNGVKRDVVEYDGRIFLPEFIYNAAWRMFAYITLYLPLFSQLVKNDMLLTRINSDFSQKSFVMLCEECLQISIYFHPLVFQMVSHGMLLSMINSDFGLKSFVILYVKNVCKYLFIFTPYFLKLCLTTFCWVW